MMGEKEATLTRYARSARRSTSNPEGGAKIHQHYWVKIHDTARCSIFSPTEVVPNYR